MSRCEALQDEQWELVAPLLIEMPRCADGRNCPRYNERATLNGLVWIVRSDGPVAKTASLVPDVPLPCPAMGCDGTLSGIRSPGSPICYRTVHTFDRLYHTLLRATIFRTSL